MAGVDQDFNQIRKAPAQAIDAVGAGSQKTGLGNIDLIQQNASPGGSGADDTVFRLRVHNCGRPKLAVGGATFYFANFDRATAIQRNRGGDSIAQSSAITKMASRKGVRDAAARFRSLDANHQGPQFIRINHKLRRKEVEIGPGSTKDQVEALQILQSAEMDQLSAHPIELVLIRPMGVLKSGRPVESIP